MASAALLLVLVVAVGGSDSALNNRVALHLALLQAKVYPNESGRQDEFRYWYNKYMESPKLEIPAASSSAARELGANDGVATFTADGKQYIVVILEAKGEISASGDPMFQTLRYIQLWYKVCLQPQG